MPPALSPDHRSFASSRVTGAGVPEAAYAYPSAVYPPAFPKETPTIIPTAFLSRQTAAVGLHPGAKNLRFWIAPPPRPSSSPLLLAPSSSPSSWPSDRPTTEARYLASIRKRPRQTTANENH